MWLTTVQDFCLISLSLEGESEAAEMRWGMLRLEAKESCKEAEKVRRDGGSKVKVDYERLKSHGGDGKRAR